MQALMKIDRKIIELNFRISFKKNNTIKFFKKIFDCKQKKFLKNISNFFNPQFLSSQKLDLTSQKKSINHFFNQPNPLMHTSHMFSFTLSPIQYHEA
jgi:hypothetical protein